MAKYTKLVSADHPAWDLPENYNCNFKFNKINCEYTTIRRDN